MILYFSGTGNSEYTARRIGKEIQDETVNLFEKIKTGDHSPLHSRRPWIVMAPTYAWRLPRIVRTWLEHTPLTGNRDLYFILTCGADIGNADHDLRRFCAWKQMNYKGCLGITMPENYIALFTTPSQEEALSIIDRAESIIDQAAQEIQKGMPFPELSPSLSGRVCSGIVNDLFYPMFVHARKFRVTDACVSCGKCVSVCPFCNIRLKDGKPVWGTHCTHCMACICRCPAEAIEYGRHSVGLPRYVCPKK